MSNWKTVRLGNVVSILGDGLHGTPKYDKNGSYYFINGNNLSDGKIIIKPDTKRINETEYVKYKKELNSRTILVSINGTIGNVALYNGEKCILGKSACYFNILTDIDKGFVKYIVIGDNFQSYIKQYANGTTIKNVSLKVMRDYEFQLPPIEEQRRIAEVLGALDDKIECNNRINRNLEEQAAVLFRRWFVDFDKKDFGKIDLGSVIETTSGGTPSRSNNEYYENGIIHWVKSKELNGSFIISTEEKITKDAIKKSSAKRLPANSILIAMYGATVGEYGIISKEMTCNQAICALIPNEKYPYTFLLNFVKYNKEMMINLAVGSAQQNISQQLIKSLPIINCTDKIKEFYMVVGASYEQMKINMEENRSLADLRDTLLPKLMNNEIKTEQTI